MGKISDVLHKIVYGRRLNIHGHEVPDPRPVSMPLGYKHPPTLQERIATMIKTQLSEHAARDGYETWQEANDFEVGDDHDELYPDEDEKHALNDPYVERAYRDEEEKLKRYETRKNAQRAREENYQRKNLKKKNEASAQRFEASAEAPEGHAEENK